MRYFAGDRIKFKHIRRKRERGEQKAQGCCLVVFTDYSFSSIKIRFVGQNIIIGSNSLFEDSRHLQITCKSLHTMKTEKRMFDDISSALRYYNKTDQTTENWEWAPLPLRLCAAMWEAFPSAPLCAGDQWGASGCRGLSKLVEGQGRIKDHGSPASAVPVLWNMRVSAKEREMAAARDKSIIPLLKQADTWVECCRSQDPLLPLPP